MNYYNEIKTELINNEITKRVKDYSKNKSDLTTYYNVGKLLSEAGKHYGEGIIKEYSIKLTNELGKGYNITSLKRMRKFYIVIQKGAPLAHQLSWSNYIELLPLNNINKINYYINECLCLNLTKRELRNKIKSNEYERLPEETKTKLITKQELEIKNLIKDPNNIEIIKEKMLLQLILEDIPSFLKELGNSFCFISNEYKIKLGDTYNYIDKNLKTIEENKTIGIIICKKDNKYILEYCSDKRITSKEYILLKS